MTLAIGSTVWIFDVNVRTYIKGQSGPVYREHFQPVQIEGETKVSWILGGRGYGRKINKKTLDGIFTTEAQINDQCWVHDERYKISRRVDQCRDADTLRKIAALLDERKPR